MKKIVTRIISVFIIAAFIMSAGCVSTAVPSEQEHKFMEIGEQEPATQSQQETVEKEPDHGRPRTIREEQTLVIIGPDQPSCEATEERKFSVAVEWLMYHTHIEVDIKAENKDSVAVQWLMNNVHMSFTEGAPEVAPEDKSPLVAWLLNHVYMDTTHKEQKTPNMNSEEKSLYGFKPLVPNEPGKDEQVTDQKEYQAPDMKTKEPEIRLPTPMELEEFGLELSLEE